MLSHYSDKNMGRLYSKLGNKSNVNDYYWPSEITFKNNWFGTHDRPHGVHFIAFIVVGRISVSLMSLATPVKLSKDQAIFFLHPSIVFIFRIQSSDKMARRQFPGNGTCCLVAHRGANGNLWGTQYEEAPNASRVPPRPPKATRRRLVGGIAENPTISFPKDAAREQTIRQ